MEPLTGEGREGTPGLPQVRHSLAAASRTRRASTDRTRQRADTGTSSRPYQPGSRRDVRMMVMVVMGWMEGLAATRCSCRVHGRQAGPRGLGLTVCSQQHVD